MLIATRQRGKNIKSVRNIDKLDKRQKKYLKEKFDIPTWKDLTPTILKESMKELTDSSHYSNIMI